MSALENRQLAMLEKLNELTNKVRLMAAKQLQAPAAAAQAAKAPSAASPAVGKKFNKCGKKAPAYILQRTLQIEKNGEGKPIDVMQFNAFLYVQSIRFMSSFFLFRNPISEKSLSTPTPIKFRSVSDRSKRCG